MNDDENFTLEWRKLFEENCMNWDARNIQRFHNIPNDPDDVTEDELEACKELIYEVNLKKAQ